MKKSTNNTNTNTTNNTNNNKNKGEKNMMNNVWKKDLASLSLTIW